MSKRETSREAIFAANVKRFRESQNMTQTDLARLMAERGFSFHQQTVQRIENGSRPVRLDEAYHLADALGGDIRFMSYSVENVRTHEKNQALSGALELTTGLITGFESWCSRYIGMASHLHHQIETNGVLDERGLAGLAILERIYAWKFRTEEATTELNREFLDYVLDEPVAEEPEEPTPEDELRISALLAANKVPKRLKSMTIGELADIYAPGVDNAE